MIGKLSGKIDSCFSDYAIIDISGVGYLVYCSSRTLNQLVINESYQLFIETHVREDHINLYGFLSLEEKSFFNLLQSVNGIGTRMALTILSGLSLQEIQSAIIKRDKDVFKSVSGVGLKLAERIIVELKGKIPNNVVDAGEILTEIIRPYLSLIKPKIIEPKGLAITLTLNMAKNNNNCLSFPSIGKKLLDKVSADKPKRA